MSEPNAVADAGIYWGDDSPKNKVCTKCGETLPVEAFHRKTESPDGRHTRCKECSFIDRKKQRGIKVRLGDMMTCQVCGKEIVRTGSRQKYCQSLCEPMPGLALECSCCGEVKGYENFYDHRYNVDGKIPGVCRECATKRVLRNQKKKEQG